MLGDSFRHNRHQGHIGAALVLGGVDATGPHLFTIHPHGSTDKLPYVTMGSGSLAAMAVFESGWEPNMSVSPFAHCALFLHLTSPPPSYNSPLARSSAGSRTSSYFGGYLQRSRLRLKH